MYHLNLDGLRWCQFELMILFNPSVLTVSQIRDSSVKERHIGKLSFVSNGVADRRRRLKQITISSENHWTRPTGSGKMEKETIECLSLGYKSVIANVEDLNRI